MRRCRGPHAAPARATAWSRSGRYGRCSHALSSIDVSGRGRHAEPAQGNRARSARLLYGLPGRLEESRRAGRKPRAAAGLGGGNGARDQRQGDGAERAFCRDQGAARGLLSDRGPRPRERALLGAAQSHRVARRGRGASRLGVEETAEAVARRSYGKLVAILAARTRDVAGAEDALSEAFAAALAEWPARGVPRAPEAWLLTVARRKLVDAARRRQIRDESVADLALLAEELGPAADEEAQLPDERLRLMFTCAHPAIDAGVRAPLILQTVLGFDAGAIASAFLVAPATMAQRLVRAKSRIRQAGIPFRVPERAELAERLDAVLDAIYAIYAEGWSDPAGTEARRRNLADEGIWLGRLVASLLPGEPEVLGLLALMLYAEARRNARRDAQGEYVPLAQQDPAAWDPPLIDEAEALLLRASSAGRI